MTLQLHPRITGLGTETAFDVLARAEALAQSGRDIINLGIGQPDFHPPEHILEAAARAMRDGHHGYTQAAGIPELRRAVADDVRERRGVVITPEQVVIVPGGKMTMFFAIMMLGAPGVEVMYPDPGFPIYQSVIHFSGATGVPVLLREERGFTPDVEELLGLISPRTRLLILNFPGNPTGAVMRRTELDRLVEGLQRYPDLVVLSDEIYSRLVFGEGTPCLASYPEIRDRVILLDGWSKTYAMTGWRIGYGVWPGHLVEYATRLAINSNSCVNSIAQYAALAALRGPQDAVEQMKAAFAGRRDLIVDGLNRLPGFHCCMPGGAFYAFPNITATGYDARDLQDALLEQAGVATIAGTSFGAGGAGFLRFSYASSTDNINAALTRMQEFLARE